jgi:plasmid segregation protein ParM
MKLLGLDVGYGFVKVTDGNLGYSFPSVIGDGDANDQTLNFGKSLSRINNLKIIYKNKIYRVGDSAIRHSNYLYRDLSLSRSYGSDFDILFLAALSLFSDGSETNFKVVTGLPPERMHMADTIKDLVRGEHLFSVFENRKYKEITLEVLDVEVIPQPIGTFWAEYAQSIVEGKNLGLSKIGVIDIGFGTSDFAVIEDQEYIPQKSFTIPIGMSTAYKEISKALLAEYGIAKESHSLDEIIIKRKIRKAGMTYDISPVIDNCLEKLSRNIMVEINSNWVTDEFDKILFTGGGSQALGKFLVPKFEQGMTVEDAFIANSKGYYNWAAYLWS